MQKYIKAQLDDILFFIIDKNCAQTMVEINKEDQNALISLDKYIKKFILNNVDIQQALRLGLVKKEEIKNKMKEEAELEIRKSANGERTRIKGVYEEKKEKEFFSKGS
jgi:hypothetical protein